MEIVAKKVKGHQYTWVYLDLPKEAIEEMLLLGEEIDKADLYTKEAEGGLEKTPHVTIKYGLETEEPKDPKNRLEEEKGGEFYLGESSIFETEKYDVVKIEVESEDLKRLHDRLNELPHNDKYPDYHAHATIAYVKKGTGKKYIGKFKINKNFKFKEVYFGNNKRNYKIKLAEILKELTWMRISSFNKDLYKLAVKERILNAHDYRLDDLNLQDETEESLVNKGFDKEEIDIILD